MSKKELKHFAKKIAKDRHYCRKIIYGGPKTHDDDGNPVYVEKYVGNGPKKEKVPVTKEKKAVAVMLVGYCDQSLANFQAMYKEAKKSFPKIKRSDVTCGMVTQSSYVKGFTLIMFTVPNKPVKGWKYYDSNIDFGY